MRLQEIGIHFENQTRADLLIRTMQAVEHLLAQIQEAYFKAMKGSDGAAGAIGALTTSVQNSQGLLAAIIGTTEAAKYFRYLEYGVKPASDDPAAGQAYTLSRPSMKFASRLAAWITKARLSIPARFKAKDEATSRLQWAFAMAWKRKRFGYKGLHIIQRIAEREAATIKRILEQGV